ncbi:MAG TPA: hypothetical protein VM802_10260 [Chitinophaga sp.]|uniref:hypothetical protein n=1 Tax=Chitinophaga sp. TaxID=1869181 RepID=UPI002C5E8BEA|nr:hypothetical protein [Chitinophaga sp.]HVI45246.1 hypothetical protein [Chitinophaga sp.]
MKKITTQISMDAPDNIILNQDDEVGLTPELLKTFPGCEHYTDEQAIEIVRTLKQVAEILYLAIQKNIYNVDYQLEAGTNLTSEVTNLPQAA